MARRRRTRNGGIFSDESSLVCVGSLCFRAQTLMLSYTCQARFRGWMANFVNLLPTEEEERLEMESWFTGKQQSKHFVVVEKNRLFTSWPQEATPSTAVFKRNCVSKKPKQCLLDFKHFEMVTISSCQRNTTLTATAQSAPDFCAMLFVKKPDWIEIKRSPCWTSQNRPKGWHYSCLYPNLLQFRH